MFFTNILAESKKKLKILKIKKKLGGKFGVTWGVYILQYFSLKKLQMIETVNEPKRLDESYEPSDGDGTSPSSRAFVSDHTPAVNTLNKDTEYHALLLDETQQYQNRLSELSRIMAVDVPPCSSRASELETDSVGLPRRLDRSLYLESLQIVGKRDTLESIVGKNDTISSPRTLLKLSYIDACRKSLTTPFDTLSTRPLAFVVTAARLTERIQSLRLAKTELLAHKQQLEKRVRASAVRARNDKDMAELAQSVATDTRRASTQLGKDVLRQALQKSNARVDMLMQRLAVVVNTHLAPHVLAELGTPRSTLFKPRYDDRHSNGTVYDDRRNPHFVQLQEGYDVTSGAAVAARMRLFFLFFMNQLMEGGERVLLRADLDDPVVRMLIKCQVVQAVGPGIVGMREFGHVQDAKIEVDV